MEFCNYLPQETKELGQHWGGGGGGANPEASIYFLDAEVHSILPQA